jgi:TonB family protein
MKGYFHFFALFLVIGLLDIKAQESRIEYFKDVYCSKEVKKEKAIYAKLIISDGAYTKYEITDIKSNKILERVSSNGLEPVEVWIQNTGSGTIELDYDFELVYDIENREVSSLLKDIPNLLADFDSLHYSAPTLSGKKFDSAIMEFIVAHIHYPQSAKDMDIAGTVYVSFEVAENGHLRNIAIRRGVHVILDKECVRVMRQLPQVKPATLNGAPIPISFTFPVKFSLK